MWTYFELLDNCFLDISALIKYTSGTFEILILMSKLIPLSLRPLKALTQVDILAALVDPRAKGHVFGGLPTAFGKSLPQMLVSLLSPKGE